MASKQISISMQQQIQKWIDDGNIVLTIQTNGSFQCLPVHSYSEGAKLLQKLANINYSEMTVSEWLDSNGRAALSSLPSTRAFNTIYYNYCKWYSGAGRDKTMRELIADVESGDIRKHRNVGKKTHKEIKEVLRSTLKINLP